LAKNSSPFEFSSFDQLTEPLTMIGLPSGSLRPLMSHSALPAGVGLRVSKFGRRPPELRMNSSASQPSVNFAST
jgi:hypothetical protein